MQHLRNLHCIALLSLFSISIDSVLSSNINNNLIANKLENGLNNQNRNLLESIFVKKSFESFEKQYLNFQESNKGTKWTIQSMDKSQDKNYIDIKISSLRNIGGQTYNLNSKQKVEIKTYNNKIKSFNIINEESILRSQNSPLIIKINSPERVKPGERYEVNLIIEEPLDNALVAAGMITLKNNKLTNLSENFFGIHAISSGGLFKFIQAPLKPGSQTISAIIAHPKGIYSITKKIQVDSENQSSF